MADHCPVKAEVAGSSPVVSAHCTKLSKYDIMDITESGYSVNGSTIALGAFSLSSNLSILTKSCLFIKKSIILYVLGYATCEL